MDAGDEHISEDRQEQLDEVEALQAIYVDEFVAISDTEFQLCLSPCLADTPVYVHLVNEPADAASNDPANSIDEATHKTNTVCQTEEGYVRPRFPVQHLPPFRLQITQPHNYPSERPPKVRLGCDWLTPQQLDTICAKLVELWEEQVGMVVVFTWADFLVNTALEELGIQEVGGPSVLPLHEAVDGEPVAEREGFAVECGAADAVRVMEDIVENDNTVRQALFMQENHCCGICFTECPGREMIVVPACFHTFCSDCLSQCFTVNIREGSIAQIKCPDPSCAAPVLPQCVKALVSEEEFERFETLQVKTSLEAMPDVYWCPKCQTPAIKGQGDVCTCQACFFDFCVLCSAAWHPGVKCMSEEERLLALESRSKQTQADTVESQRKALDARNQFLSLQAIREGGNTKPCPVCRTGIEKASGCNKMHCTNCNVKFCWICLETVTDYSHFRVEEGQPATGCQGKLFEGTEMDMNVADQFGGWIGDQARGAAQGRPLQGRRVTYKRSVCPNCKQMNLKEARQNHIRCWNCRKGYCYLCGQLTNSTKHFGPKACPQHSDD